MRANAPGNKCDNRDGASFCFSAFVGRVVPSLLQAFVGYSERRAMRNVEKRVSRRNFLQAGSLAALGLTLPDLLRSEGAERGRPRVRSCILVYLFGGPAHIDLWDMKPDAPAEIRGEFRPMPTRVPGILLCDQLPRLGQVADRLAIVRSLSHDRNVHGAAVGLVLTGVPTLDSGIPGVRGPDSSVNDHPNLGSAIGKFCPPPAPVPAAVTLPNILRDGGDRFLPGQNAGLLGAAHDPWFIDKDPSSPDFRVEGLNLPTDLSARRLADRRTLLLEVDAQRRALDLAGQARQLGAHQQKAFSLLTSSQTQTAFQLDREPEPVRNRFGRTRFGQSCLLACRLVEAGVRCVQVNMGQQLAGPNDWDTHFKNFSILRDSLCPVFDRGFAALLAERVDRKESLALYSPAISVASLVA